MERSELERQLREMVVEVSGVRPEDVKTESTLADDLFMDELDVTELVMKAELEFNIDLPVGAIQEMKTFGDLVEAVAKSFP